MHKRYIILALMICAVSLSIAFLLPRSAGAQCGSSASSCKTCHEVQAKAPVNTQGAWHTQHAFGDFCEFCHAGNVKSKDKAGAHTGLIAPLADVQGSCQSCHPSDYTTRATGYGTTLGIAIGTGAKAANPTPAAGAAGTTAGSSPDETAATNSACAPSAPTSGQVIDIDRVYAGLDQATMSMLGNFALLGLIGITALGLFALIWHFEKPLPRLVNYLKKTANMPVLNTVTPEGIIIPISAETARRPEYRNLERALAKSDPATVGAVSKLLADQENAPQVLVALSNMDLKMLSALSKSDPKTLQALLAFAQEMKSNPER